MKELRLGEATHPGCVDGSSSALIDNDIAYIMEQYKGLYAVEFAMIIIGRAIHRSKTQKFVKDVLKLFEEKYDDYDLELRYRNRKKLRAKGKTKKVESKWH